MSQSGSAFVTAGGFAASNSSARRGTCARQVVRCAAVDTVVDYYFPAERRNKAPMITFGTDNEVTVGDMVVAEPEAPLLDYGRDVFIPAEVPDMGIAWPSGDGRQEKQTGTKGSFNQPDLKEYGPFPDFLKRSCDL